mgnify:CR=1 FL=1
MTTFLNHGHYQTACLLECILLNRSTMACGNVRDQVGTWVVLVQIQASELRKKRLKRKTSKRDQQRPRAEEPYRAQRAQGVLTVLGTQKQMWSIPFFVGYCGSFLKGSHPAVPVLWPVCLAECKFSYELARRRLNSGSGLIKLT